MDMDMQYSVCIYLLEPCRMYGEAAVGEGKKKAVRVLSSIFSACRRHEQRTTIVPVTGNTCDSVIDYFIYLLFIICYLYASEAWLCLLLAAINNL